MHEIIAFRLDYIKSSDILNKTFHNKMFAFNEKQIYSSKFFLFVWLSNLMETFYNSLWGYSGWTPTGQLEENIHFNQLVIKIT